MSLPLPPAESVDVSSMASLMKGMIGLFGALFFKGRTGDDEPVCDRAVFHAMLSSESAVSSGCPLMSLDY